jgi:putative transposase
VGTDCRPCPARVDAPVKKGLLELVAHAHEHGGWSLRQSAGVLGIEHTRLLRWATRAVEDRLADAKPGPLVQESARSMNTQWDLY